MVAPEHLSIRCQVSVVLGGSLIHLAFGSRQGEHSASPQGHQLQAPAPSKVSTQATPGRPCIASWRLSSYEAHSAPARSESLPGKCEAGARGLLLGLRRSCHNGTTHTYSAVPSTANSRRVQLSPLQRISVRRYVSRPLLASPDRRIIDKCTNTPPSSMIPRQIHRIRQSRNRHRNRHSRTSSLQAAQALLLEMKSRRTPAKRLCSTSRFSHVPST